MPRLRADALQFWHPVGLRFQGSAYSGERRGAELPTSGGSPSLTDRQHLGATPTPDTQHPQRTIPRGSGGGLKVPWAIERRRGGRGAGYNGSTQGLRRSAGGDRGVGGGRLPPPIMRSWTLK